MGAGCLDDRQHDGRPHRHRARSARTGGSNRQRLARDVRHRCSAGAAWSCIFRRLKEPERWQRAARDTTRGSGSLDRAVLRSALAAAHDHRACSSPSRVWSDCGASASSALICFASCSDFRTDLVAPEAEDVLDRHDVAAAEPGRILRHLRVHATSPIARDGGRRSRSRLSRRL